MPRHRYARTIAQASLKSRLIAIETLQEQRGSHLFYEGEQQILHNALHDLENLEKPDEVRRLSDLTANMYYRDPVKGYPQMFRFQEADEFRPQCDPINAIFWFGYAMLFGNCCVSVIGARLDPDLGLLHKDAGSLVRDFIGPFKAEMIDHVVCSIARDSLKPGEFEQTSSRCMLSDT